MSKSKKSVKWYDRDDFDDKNFYSEHEFKKGNLNKSKERRKQRALKTLDIDSLRDFNDYEY